MTNLTIEICYPNGDLTRKTVPSSTILTSTMNNLFSDMDTYINQHYPDAQNFFIYYEGSMLYSKTHKNALQALFTATTE